MVVQTIRVDLGERRQKHKLTVPEGTTQLVQFTLKDQDNVAINLTSGTMTFAVYQRTRLKTGAPAALFSKTVGTGIALTTPLSGIATLTIAATDTDDLANDLYDWELELVDSAARVWLAGYGEFVISPARRLDGS